MHAIKLLIKFIESSVFPMSIKGSKICLKQGIIIIPVLLINMMDN